MRWNGLRWLAGCWLALVHFPDPALAADGPRDDRMAAIVAAVRAEEAKFKDIEYVVRIVVRDTSPKGPNRADDVKTMATRHAIYQGDWTYFRLQAFERGSDTKFRREEISAYDGERTRTVVAGNSANIHLGRWQHPDLCPAHSLPLAHVNVAFPLSVFLGGTEAVRAHTAYVGEIAQFGVLDAYSEVAARFESEDVVDGLRCLTVRVDRRYSGNAPALQELWLAPERNYHCIKARLSWPDGRLGDLPSREMRVEGLRELVPGVWFPTRIAVDEYDAKAPGRHRESAVGRTVMTVEKVELAPHRAAAFFRDVPVPAELPVFTIKDRELAGWTPPRPIDDDRGRANLARLAARVAEQERRYDGLEVKAHERQSDINPDTLEQNRVAEWSSEGRSIQRKDRSFSTSRSDLFMRSGERSELSQTLAHDGQWTRILAGRRTPDGSPSAVVLRKGRRANERAVREATCPHQPHTLVLREYPARPALEDLLDASRAALSGRFAGHLRHCGAAEVGGHPCIVLAGGLTPMRGRRPGGLLVLYMATDRNDIPIKMEYFNPYIAGRYVPQQFVTAGDFREIAEGLWYPFRITALGFENGPRMARGWFVLAWRRDTTIDSATLAPAVERVRFPRRDRPRGGHDSGPRRG